MPSRAERREHVRLHGAERHTRDTGRKTLVSPELTATLLAGAAAVGPEPEADGRAREEVIVDALAVLWDQPEAMSRELRAIYVCGRSSPPFAFVEAEIAALLAELGGASAPGGPVDEGREPFRHALSVLDFELNDEETARLYPDEDFPPCPEPPR